jgi:hypothetical protein
MSTTLRTLFARWNQTHPGRHCRRRPGGIIVVAFAPPRRHRLGDTEARSRNEIEATLRAGVLEQGTVDSLRECGVGGGCSARVSVHHGIELLFDRERHRIPCQS